MEGVHYYVVKPSPATAADDPVEVTEFFMYTCPHCMQFEPYLEKWIEGEPEDVTLKLVPVMFGGPADLHARAFFALDLMGDRERLHDAFFTTIHKKRQRLKTERELRAFLEQQGVDMEKFQAAWDSFAVQTKLNRARALMRRYNIRSVPTVVVDGRYRSGNGFHSYDEKIELIDDLVAKVRNDRLGVAQQAAPALREDIAENQ
jgi:thiol:disulfide interchange protein DsbA